MYKITHSICVVNGCICLFVCLFVWSLCFMFFTHMETSPSPVKGCKFRPMLGIHGHWAVSVPHPLRHGPTVYNGHLRGPVTLTPVAERSRSGTNPDLPHARRTLYLYATAVMSMDVNLCTICMITIYSMYQYIFFPSLSFVKRIFFSSKIKWCHKPFSLHFIYNKKTL